ncbi:hypothetical protein QQP08_003510 [Theobroma cacao]|nr:hypothetical protein QQP08_003510 [Theobroma cacao]
MGRLTAEVLGDDRSPGKGKTKASKKADAKNKLNIVFDRRTVTGSTFEVRSATGMKPLPAAAGAAGRFDVRTQTSAAIAVGIAMTGKVDHGSLTIAKCCKKSYVHEVIVTRGTSLRQGTLISVLTPVNSNSTSINSNNEEKNH